jgi:hypothetical protein
VIVVNLTNQTNLIVPNSIDDVFALSRDTYAKLRRDLEELQLTPAQVNQYCTMAAQ